MADYDVIVIGGGHAGAEAATLAARSGAATLLITQNLETIGQMSCNPAIGGIAKGTVVREVDALGGVMGRATDAARIQFRMLNRSKGPAVWSPRAQCDRGLYRRAVRRELEQQPRIRFGQGTVARLLIAGGRVTGVETTDGRRFGGRAVVLTAGTFLRGRIHVGTTSVTAAGRAGDPPSEELSQDIVNHGLTVERFKTGTPPRIDGRTVRLADLERQDGDVAPFWFSHFLRGDHPPQLPCYLTHTTPRLQEIIEAHLGQSAMYGGAISSRGPRYCPSIEDKIVRFPEAVRHQVFLEPEGLDTSEMYVNGLSTSLPADVQLAYLRSVPGLELVDMTRPGYAIEYDYYPPSQLDHTLAVRGLRGLYLAGQVNGTTGYEEAAGQGVVAGLNAACHALGREPVTFDRASSFIGVLIDDLVTKGVDEPYRLFTSRSEFRLMLRQDNALRRLGPMAERLGLFGERERRVMAERLAAEDLVYSTAMKTAISPAAAQAYAGVTLQEPTRIAEVAKRPGVALVALLKGAGVDVDPDHAAWSAVEIRYQGYLERERVMAARLVELEGHRLPADLDYRSMASVSSEAREKLASLRPMTLGHASRIPGVSPSDIQGIWFHLQRSN